MLKPRFSVGDLVSAQSNAVLSNAVLVIEPDCGENYKYFLPRIVVRTLPNMYGTEYFFEDNLELIKAAAPLTPFELLVQEYIKLELNV